MKDVKSFLSKEEQLEPAGTAYPPPLTVTPVCTELCESLCYVSELLRSVGKTELGV